MTSRLRRWWKSAQRAQGPWAALQQSSVRPSFVQTKHSAMLGSRLARDGRSGGDFVRSGAVESDVVAEYWFKP